MIKKWIFSLLLSSFSMSAIFAQDKIKPEQDKINTDHPDHTDGTTVIDPKTFQFETQVYVNRFDAGKDAIIASSLLRYGLFKNIEARILVEQGQERDRFISETTQGMYPLALSAKIALLKDKKYLPDISLIPYLHVPVTSQKGNYGYWSPLVTLAMEKQLDKLTIAANGSYKQEAFEKQWLWQASGELKYEFSERFSVFAEYFAQYGHEEAPLHNVDGGLLYYISPDWLVHVAAGSTIFHEEKNYFGNLGVAFRVH
jgi:hypothetical protein